MRITSGIARGISLDAPKGSSTRPATDAAREALFSHLGEAVAGAAVLDLFAGTGSYGLEAASRGAARAVFAENDPRAFACLKKNAAAVSKALRAGGSEASLETLSLDCARAAKNLAGTKFDIVFADPPYSMLLSAATLSKVLSTLALVASEETIFALEAPADFELPDSIESPAASFQVLRRLGKKSKGKPSQIIFKIEKK